MKEISLARLAKIYNHLLHNVSEDEFSMGHWSCGTVSCIMGHAANIPEFKELGLSLEDDGLQAKRLTFKKDGRLYLGGFAAEALLKIERGDSLVIRDLDGCKKAATITDTISYLFYPHTYEAYGAGKKVTKQDAMNRLEDFISINQPVIA